MAAAVLALPLALGACNSEEKYDPNEESRSPHEHYLLGFAYADGPLSGARIRVYSTDGKLIADEPRATESGGTFHVEDSNLPAHYRVVATGGRHEGKAFEGELRAEVRDDDGAVIHLNPVSTITSHHMEHNTEASHQEAEDAVHDHLAIPEALETEDLRVHDRHFHGDVFLAAARRNGGAGAFAKRIAREAGGEGPGTAFPGKASNQAESAAALAIAQAVGTKFLEYLGQKLADEGYGYVLATIGRDDASTESARQFAAINRELEDVKKELVDVKHGLSSITQKLAQGEYNAVVQNLPLDEVDYVMEQLAFATQSKDLKAQKQISDDLVGRGGYIPSKLQDALVKFERAFLGKGPSPTPLIDAYSEIARTKSPTSPIFTAADNKKIFAAFEYYDAYLVLALNAILEWRHAQNSDYDQSRLVDDVKTKRRNYAAKLPSKLPANAVVDTRTKLYWHARDSCGSFADAKSKLTILNAQAAEYSGFRNFELARLEQLKALVKDRGSESATGWLNTHGFSNVDFDKCSGRGGYIFSGDYAEDKAAITRLRRGPCEIAHGGDPPLVRALLFSGDQVCALVGSKKGSPLYVRELSLPGERYW